MKVLKQLLMVMLCIHQSCAAILWDKDIQEPANSKTDADEIKYYTHSHLPDHIDQSLEILLRNQILLKAASALKKTIHKNVNQLI